MSPNGTLWPQFQISILFLEGIIKKSYEQSWAALLWNVAALPLHALNVASAERYRYTH